jgi:hypothetical protein
MGEDAYVLSTQCTVKLVCASNAKLC